MRVKWIVSILAVVGLGLAVIVWQSSGQVPGKANGNGKAGEATLPIKHVVLFNSGVGYFQREGEVNGDHPHRSVLSRQRHQRPLEEPGSPGFRRRHRQQRQLRQSRSDRQDPAQLRPRSQQQSDAQPNSQPGPRREDRSHAASGGKRRARVRRSQDDTPGRHHRRHGNSKENRRQQRHVHRSGNAEPGRRNRHSRASAWIKCSRCAS